MHSQLSVFCVCICIVICSTEKMKGDSKYDKASELTKEKKWKQEEIDRLIKLYNITDPPPKSKSVESDSAVKSSNYYDDTEYGDDEYTFTTEIKNETAQRPIYITDSIHEDYYQDADNATLDSEKNGTCPECERLEQEKQVRLQEIKNRILNKLGFSSNNLPNVTKKTLPYIPAIQHLMEGYEMQSDAPYDPDEDYYPEDDIYGQVKRAYTIGQPMPDSWGVNVQGGTYFDIAESVRSRKVQDASLWLYIRPDEDDEKEYIPKHKMDNHRMRHKRKEKQVYEIHLYIVQPKTKPHQVLKSPKRYKKTSSTGWMEFKLVHFVHHWLKNPNANRGIIIQAFDSKGRSVSVTPDDVGEEKYFPTLEMWTAEHRDKHHRSKRYVNNVCTESERIETCCRYPLRVDFVQFGWDWVIAPTGYDANYCSGECRHRHMENHPQAYLIQQAPEGAGPCCTPSKFFPLAMLYFDHQQNVLYTYMQKMVVHRCGCA